MTDPTTLPLGHSSYRGTRTTAQSKANMLWLGGALLVLFLALVCTWLPYVPPLQDYGDWTYQGYLIKRILAGEGSAVAYLKPWPVPNSTTQAILAVLNFVFLPITASKIFISAYLLFAGFAMWLIARPHEQPRGGLNLFLIIGLIVLHGSYWNGEINYQIGLCLLLFYIFVVARDRQPWMSIDCSYAILLFFCHGLCLGVFLIYVGFRALSRRRILQTSVSVLPALMLAGWYVLLEERNRSARAAFLPRLTGSTEGIAYRLYELMKIGPYQNLIVNDIGDYERARLFYYSGIVVNSLFALVLALLFAAWAVESLRRRRLTAEFMTALACVGLAILAPMAAPSVGELTERLFYPALGIAVLSYSGGHFLRKAGAVLAIFLPVYLAHAFVIMPAGIPSRGTVENAAIDQGDRRYQLLFWHRPFLNVPQAVAAEEAATAGVAPSLPIAFDTSLLEPRENVSGSQTRPHITP